MLTSLCKELSARRVEFDNEFVDTIYFGGGTPGILLIEELEQLVKCIRQNYQVNPQAEITLECNPDDVTEASVLGWKIAGVNRVSIGVQSLRDSDLKWMNRAHDASMAIKAIELIQQSGILNITADLIYGLPRQSIANWKKNLSLLISMGIPHISAYCLTIEKGTALHNWINNGRINSASEELQVMHFKLLRQLLLENNYVHYEISNFAVPGYESQHNQSYWSGKSYLGIGPSAHSFNGIGRRWNIANNRNYIRALEQNQIYWVEETLSPSDRFNEKLLTGLRTNKGVNLNELSAIDRIPANFDTEVESLQRIGWLQRTDAHISITEEGLLRTDHITSRLFKVN